MTANIKKKYIEQIDYLRKINRPKMEKINEMKMELNDVTMAFVDFFLKESYDFYNLQEFVFNLKTKDYVKMLNVFEEAGFPHRDLFFDFFKVVGLVRVWEEVELNNDVILISGFNYNAAFKNDAKNIVFNLFGECHFQNLFNVPTNCVHHIELMETLLWHYSNNYKNVVFIMESAFSADRSSDSVDDLLGSFVELMFASLEDRHLLNIPVADYITLYLEGILRTVVDRNFTNPYKSELNMSPKISFHCLDFRNLFPELYKNKRSFRQNPVIFWEGHTKFPNFAYSTKYKNRTIYYEEYMTLKDDGKINDSVEKLIDNNINADRNYYSWIMDQVCILHMIYCHHYMQDCAIILTGGLRHIQAYENFWRDYLPDSYSFMSSQVRELDQRHFSKIDYVDRAMVVATDETAEILRKKKPAAEYNVCIFPEYTYFDWAKIENLPPALIKSNLYKIQALNESISIPQEYFMRASQGGGRLQIMEVRGLDEPIQRANASIAFNGIDLERLSDEWGHFYKVQEENLNVPNLTGGGEGCWEVVLFAALIFCVLLAIWVAILGPPAWTSPLAATRSDQ